MIGLRSIQHTALIAFAWMLSGCALVADSSGPQVDIAPHTRVTLPTPAQLGYQVTASQLISAQWQDDTGKHSQQLPVQLQVKPQQVLLAGFSSWGTRILSLNYQNNTIDTQVMNGLENTQPKPEQVLFNLMITLWPRSAWEEPLNQVKWRMIDANNTRTILDNSGDTVIEIEYPSHDPFSGEIQFHNRKLKYTITIQTLNHRIQDVTQ